MEESIMLELPIKVKKRINKRKQEKTRENKRKSIVLLENETCNYYLNTLR